MRIVRFLDLRGAKCHGVLHDNSATTLLVGDLFGDLRDNGEPATVTKLLAPLEATAVICIGLNYLRHAQESSAPMPEFPVVFMKSPGAIQNPGDPIELPRAFRGEEIDCEFELAVVIGKTCKNAVRSNALDYVFGYTCANDVSARDWQARWGGR